MGRGAWRFPRKAQAGAGTARQTRDIRRSRSNIPRSGAFERRSRTKAQTGRPWMHDAPARVEHGLSLRQRMPPRGRNGTTRPAQRHQHGSMTKPQVF